MKEKIKVILAIGLGVLVVGLVVYNATLPKKAEDTGGAKAWNAAMAKGNPEAKNHFIVYTDIFCPYCDNFSRAIMDNAVEFEENYLTNDAVYYELRLTDIISDHSVNSERAGEAGYCAAKQGKFWQFYEGILAKLWEDYHSKGIGTSKTSPKIPELDDEYYLVGEGLDMEVLSGCLEGHETLKELKNNTTKASAVVKGSVPYFIFNDFVSSGFGGDWATVKMMFKAGGV
jgi:protein-disulfide isomerase